jgi:thiamine pyrophosphokinase
MTSDAVMTVVVFAGGDPVPADVLEDLPAPALVIAADSGLDLALDLGLKVDLLIGDLDSVTPEAMALMPGAAVDRHPRDKDATDLELAIAAAHRADADRVVVVGGRGGRLDHTLANALLLTAPTHAGMEIEWMVAGARSVVVHSANRLHGSVGGLVSLLPFHGGAEGVTTEGMRWELEDATIHPGSTWGVSNEFLLPVASVRIETGTLLAVMATE